MPTKSEDVFHTYLVLILMHMFYILESYSCSSDNVNFVLDETIQTDRNSKLV